MARFVGTHEYTLDGQGRIILPTTFRAKLADGAYLTALDRCLALLPTEEFELMADRLEARQSTGDVHPDAVRAFTSQAAEVAPDSQGRIRIKPEHQDSGGLDRNVMVVGAGKRIEIWDLDRWNSMESSRRDKLADAIEKGFGVGTV